MLSLMPPCNAFRQAIAACAITDNTCSPYQAIFSRNQITAHCTRETIHAVLQCSCLKCHEHLAGLSDDIPTQTAATLILGDNNTPPLVMTFSLLSFIGCPQFIRSCVQQQDLINDESIGNRTDGFSQQDLQRNIWGGYNTRDPIQSEEFATEFWWKRLRFFVPAINGNPYDVFQKSDLLPFIEEQPLNAIADNGEEVQEHGAFGRVFSFRIIPEYDFLSVSFPRFKLK